MTWPDVVRSVEARIHDGRAQDHELRALALELGYVHDGLRDGQEEPQQAQHAEAERAAPRLEQ